MTVSKIPQGYHAVTPYLVIPGADRAIDFYKQAFGAKERLRLQIPGGPVGHAELELGDSVIMLADEFPQMGVVGPQAGQRPPVSLCLYFTDADAVFAKAVELGATIDRPIQDQFYGDRSGTVRDPFGHYWTIATHIEDVPQEEVQKRFEAMMQQPPS